MADNKYINELISTGTGTEGSLLIVKKIHDTLIDEVDKMLIPQSEAAFAVGASEVPGSSYDVDLVVENSGSIRVIAEGGEIYLDDIEYLSFNVKPLKYGVGVRITREMLEDGKWNLLEHNIKTLSKRFAENETKLILEQLDNAQNTVAGGAAITISNITRGMQYLDDADYEPTTLLIGMEVLNDLRNIDTFVEFNKVGNTDMLKKGFLGIIYGLMVIKFSTNAAPSTTYTKYAYVYDKTHAFIRVEKRPLTVEGFNLPVHDMEAASLTQRIAYRYLRAKATTKITTT